MTTYAPIILPPPHDLSWHRAEIIARALRARGIANPMIVAAVANALAEAGWRAVIAGDHGQSFGPWQLKFQFYGEQILAKTGVDIRAEPDLKKHVDAVLCALAMPANAKTLAALEAAKTGEEATRVWAASFERASAGGAVERRVALAGPVEIWLSKLT